MAENNYMVFNILAFAVKHTIYNKIKKYCLGKFQLVRICNPDFWTLDFQSNLLIYSQLLQLWDLNILYKATGFTSLLSR